MAKIIFSDMDGTLINRQNGPLHEGNFEAIKKWREAGNLFVLCTGRNTVDICPTLNVADIEYDYLVLCNGASIFDKNGKTIQEIEFPYALGKEILLECGKNPELMTFYCDENEEVFTDGHNLKALGKDGVIREIKDVSFETYVNKAECFKMVFIVQPNGEHLLKHYEEKLLKPNAHQISWFFNRDCIDMMGGDVSKGKGMLALVDMLGIDHDDVYAVGDSYNDISMLEMASHGCTFEDSPEEVKAKANHIIPSVCGMIEMILNKKF